MSSLTSHVDPTIGTAGMGNCLIGPYLPLSLVRLGPDNLRPQPTSGYDCRYPITGFSHTHVSGTGGSARYGNIRVTPFVGPPRATVDPQWAANERSEAGYYMVTLNPTGIDCELTSTPRAGLHRYHFPEMSEDRASASSPDIGSMQAAGYDPAAVDHFQSMARASNVLIDVGAAVQRDFRRPAQGTGGSIGGYVEWLTENEVVGRGDYQGGWGHDFPYSVYFYARFDQQPKRRFVGNHAGITNEPHANGANCVAVANFGDERDITLSVGISYHSVAKARASVEREANVGFEVARKQAIETWDKQLSRIEVEGGSEEHRKLFYTLFSRLMCMPSDLGVDDEFNQWQSGVRHFTDYYCLWDSVRNANSLIALFDPKLAADMMNCLLDIAEHKGWLVDAWVAGHSAQVQGGSSADILFSEFKRKGIEGIDYHKALQYMLKNGQTPSPDPKLYGRHLHEYREQGYVTTKTINCVSRHLEYAYQDWCAGKLADELGMNDVAREKLEASEKLWNLWREDIKLFAPRQPDGQWVNPFDPKHHRPDAWNDPYFYEGNSWQWSWNAHQDFPQLVERMGGAGGFIEMLDRFFDEGMHYAKETMLHVPYLYLYAGRPDRTVDRVRQCLSQFYKTQRNGLVDNEDMGCQSAFFMASAIGFYPVMGQDFYWITSPVFERVAVQLGDAGKQLVIEAPGTSDRKRYIVGLTLNGEALDRAYIRHGEIANGGTLRFKLSEEPTDWAKNDLPTRA